MMQAERASTEVPQPFTFESGVYTHYTRGQREITLHLRSDAGVAYLWVSRAELARLLRVMEAHDRGEPYPR